MFFNNTTKKIGTIIFCLGLLLCVINLVVALGNVIFMATAEPTTGYVADVQVREWHSTTSTRNRSTHHDVTMTVEYTVDGVLYQKIFKVGNHSANEGKPITVYYKESNPDKAVTGKEANPIDGFTIFIIMLVGVLVFLKGTEQS